MKKHETLKYCTDNCQWLVVQTINIDITFWDLYVGIAILYFALVFPIRNICLIQLYQYVFLDYTIY